MAFEPSFGIGQQFVEWRTRSVCLSVVWGDKRRDFLLDDSFSPAYDLFVKKAGLQNAPSII
jgi:hypothetical protein